MDLEFLQFVIAIVQYTHYLFSSLLNFDYVQNFVNCPDHDLDSMHTKPNTAKRFYRAYFVKEFWYDCEAICLLQNKNMQLSPHTDAQRNLG